MPISSPSFQPEDLRLKVVEVLCNDCQHKGVVSFHILGHKVSGMCEQCASHMPQCASCGSYNTVVSHGPMDPK